MSKAPFVIVAGLTAIVQNYHNPAVTLIADDVMPRVNVGGELYKYDVYNTAEMFTVPDTTVSRRGAPNQVEFGATQKTGKVVDRGLDAPVPVRDIEAAAAQRRAGNTSFDPEARAVEGVTNLVRLDREVRVAEIVQNADNYDADKVEALAGGDQWSDKDNSDPLAAITDACDKTFIARPNIGVTTRRVATFLRRHPVIVESVLGTGAKRGKVRLQDLAELFELDEILVGDSYVNTARPGRDAAYARTWGNSFALLHRNRAAQAKDGLPTWGFTAEWHIKGNGAMVAGRIPDPNGGGLLGSITMRAGEFVEEHVQAKSSGFLFQNVITEAA